MTTNQTIDGVLVSRQLLCRVITTLEKPSEKWEQAGWPVASELRALLDKEVGGDSRALQAQGVPVAKYKPVAKLHAERLTGRDGEYGITVEDSQWFNTCRLTGGEFYLYADQPAPAAVVMPERRELPPLGAHFYRSGWNACLDELKRLNPSL